MEHRTLADQESLESVRQVTLETYLGLVEPINGSVVSKPGGYTLVRGPGAFSFCNFAAGFESGDAAQTVEALKDQSRECVGFYVFVMSGDKPDDLNQRLTSSGFEVRQELVSMIWEPEECQAGQKIDVVIESDERSLVANFMVEQFFWRLPPEARSAIAAATAASRHQIFKFGAADDPQAAVMLVPASGSIGLYNLCVKPELRGRGTGKSIVESIKCGAAMNNMKVVLQCESTLVQWYEDLGFKTLGSVKAYTFTGTNASDILTH